MRLANMYQKHPITGEMIPPGWFYEGEKEKAEIQEEKEPKAAEEEKNEGGTKEKTVKKG